MTTERKRATERVSLSLDTSGGSNQEDSAFTNINRTVAQFREHGTLPQVPNLNPLYGDFTFPEDIHSVREAVQRADDRFMALPSDVRNVAGNDWVQFLTMFNDPQGRQTLVEAGLQMVDPITTQTPTDPTSPPTTNPDTPPAPTNPQTDPSPSQST